MTSVSFDFTDQTVLITGASRGIGAATAQLFAQSGARVVVNYRADQAGAEQVSAAITAAGGSVTILPLPFKVRPAAQGNQFTNR